MTKCFLALLLASGQIFAAGQNTTPLRVSAVVLPNARIEIQSATAMTVRVTMYPNVQVLVWVATGVCDAPRNAQVLSDPGVHQVTFPMGQVEGRNLACVRSTDGAVNAFARLPEAR